MRNFSTNVNNILAGNTVKFYLLVELNFNNDYYFTSLPYSVTYDNNTYNPVENGSGIIEYDSPKFSSVVDRESYRIVLTCINENDQLPNLRDEIKANIVGKAITVKVGFLDANDEPITNTSDVLTVYKGYVDSPSISNDFETTTIVLEGTSPMSDLDIVKPLIASRNSADSRSGGTDRAFDKIYGDAVIRLKWGKI